RARETIDAPVLAAAIRVDRLLERHVRRIVAANDGTCALDADGGGGARLRIIRLRWIDRLRPAVVLDDMPRGFEASFRIAQRAAALQRRIRRVDGAVEHDGKLCGASVSASATRRRLRRSQRVRMAPEGIAQPPP